MKRSDMIELIVYEALSWDGLSTSGVPVEEVANDMLRVCEKMGMRPPAQETYEISDMQGNNLGVLDDVYEWEPEDKNSKQNKLKPTPLTDEELADVIANDEDLQNET